MLKMQTIEEIEKERRRIEAEIKEALSAEDEDRLIRLKAKRDIIPVKLCRARIKEANETIAGIEAEINDIKEGRKHAAAECTKLREQAERLESELRDVRKEINQAEHRRTSGQFQMDKKHQALTELSKQLSELQSELESLIGGGAE